MSTSSLLSKALKSNATFSILSGCILLFSSSFVSQLFEIDQSTVFKIIGGMLIGFAIFVFGVSTIKPPSRIFILIIILLDILWVIGSLILIVTNVFDISNSGLWIIGIIAFIIFLFAYLQIKGLKQAVSQQGI